MKTTAAMFEGNKSIITIAKNSVENDNVKASKLDKPAPNIVNDALFRKSDRLLRDNEPFEKYKFHKRQSEVVFPEQTEKKTMKQEHANAKNYYFKNLIS
jgi:hypothetical protein